VLINDKGEACLTDFGLSRMLGVSGFTTKTGSATLRFTSPELIPLEDQEQTDLPRVTKTSDVWAFSMTVIEVCIC
jgi:serine/threonine protein kinase